MCKSVKLYLYRTNSSELIVESVSHWNFKTVYSTLGSTHDSGKRQLPFNRKIISPIQTLGAWPLPWGGEDRNVDRGEVDAEKRSESEEKKGKELNKCVCSYSHLTMIPLDTAFVSVSSPLFIMHFDDIPNF